jgi:hypothetical protein
MGFRGRLLLDPICVYNTDALRSLCRERCSSYCFGRFTRQQTRSSSRVYMHTFWNSMRCDAMH